MANEKDIAKIIAGIVGVGAVGAGIYALINNLSGPSVETYDSEVDDNDNEHEEEYVSFNYGREDEEERINEPLDNSSNGFGSFFRGFSYGSEDHVQENNGFDDLTSSEYTDFTQVNSSLNVDVDYAQREFDAQKNNGKAGYLYLDFTKYRNVKTWNHNDVYKESLIEQFEKIKRRLAFHGVTNVGDFDEFVRYCFSPVLPAGYYVSLPSFDRTIQKYNVYGQDYDCIYNIVIRPEKSEILKYIIPDNLDVIIVGDLTFVNNRISIDVKGIDLVDINVQKFGELRIECLAACALQKDERNRPDFGLESRELYNSFLTRDLVLTMCQNVYPIKSPEKAIRVFEDWNKYVKFRKYYLAKQSERHECLSNVEFIKAYAVDKKEYRKNEEVYSSYLLDGFNGFLKKDNIIVDREVDESTEFPLIRVEIKRNLAEINRDIANGKQISKYEIDLRRFTRGSVALSQQEPYENGNIKHGALIYLEDRIAFEIKDVEPDCSDIELFYEKQLKALKNAIDTKYKGIVKLSLENFRVIRDSELEEELLNEIENYALNLDGKLEDDVAQNEDKEILKRYKKAVQEIKDKYQRKLKKYKSNKTDNTGYLQLVEELENSEKREIELIPLKEWYAERNEILKEKYSKSRRLHKSKQLEMSCDEKEEKLWISLQETIDEEKRTTENEILENKKVDISKKCEKMTTRHFYVYFKAGDLINDPDIDFSVLNKYKYLVYDNRAESKKIERQQKAIESFYHGYVKNPFLASYFFEAESLENAENCNFDIEWFSTRLNDSQKEAVKRALVSNSLFLLQGPPGTGKTEVIAEITAQYVKQGKKVLVSSETHKAIDNVFERLPKIPEIRPLRLIPYATNKETEYSPENLVDNLYLGISSRLGKRISQFENFNELKENFSSEMKNLRFRYDELLTLEKNAKDISVKKEKLKADALVIDNDIEGLRSTKSPLIEEKDEYDILVKYINAGKFNEQIEKKEMLDKLSAELFEMVLSNGSLGSLSSDKIANLYLANIDDIRSELQYISENTSAFSVEQQKIELKAKMQELRDPDTDDILEDKKEEYARLRQKLISLKNSENENKIDYSQLAIATFVPVDKLSNSVDRVDLLRCIVELKGKISSIVSKYIEGIIEIISNVELEISKIDKEIVEMKERKNRIINEIESLNDDETYLEYRRKQQELRKSIIDFFADFDIHDEYELNDFSTAIDIINKRWIEIEKNQQALEKENKSRVPMYKKIQKYLSDEDVIKEDRINYTKKLFDNVNVFGMTCTSRETFKPSTMRALQEYNLGDLNVRNQGIDVVIIDEVSKSSFLDLLIPVLYGKTVILVGDHRQLPPLYDLKHMRRGDFEGLDSEIIDYDLNKQYQVLYETCFFKELFEKVPASYKIMLDKQYRCHSDIMDVFNHFYNTNGKGLEIGVSNQNDLKQHGLHVKSKGMSIFEPQNHIYFINCTSYESRQDKESSSIINLQEAQVVCKLLNMIDNEYGQMIENGTIVKNFKKDERKSVGVICTYRDQARCIKNLLRGMKFTNISTKREERLIINTVDDFQGDERDIIIVSMVRNPKGDRYSTEFIDQFERINVALSRARCMLVIVGSQNFLSRSSIDLPDVSGNKDFDKLSFPVYKEIIHTIQNKGKILQATDILGEVNGNAK